MWSLGFIPRLLLYIAFTQTHASFFFTYHYFWILK
jgi:hypothetical protein